MRISVIILLCYLSFSCNGKYKTLSQFSYCNEGVSTNLDTLIDIDGVYYVAIIRDVYNKPFPVHKIDTFYLNVIFWRDGTVVYNTGGNPSTYQSYFDDIIANPKIDYFFKTQGWGNYRIVDDTIKIQAVYIPGSFFSLNQSWYCVEPSYRIVNRNTLEYLPGKKVSAGRANADDLEDDKYLLAHFVPVDRIPSPNCIHKTKKWFWCTRKDWEKYMTEKRAK